MFIAFKRRHHERMQLDCFGEPLIKKVNHIFDIQMRVALNAAAISVAAHHHDLGLIEAFLGNNRAMGMPELM